MNYPKNRYTGSKPWLDKNWLYNEYVVKDRSTQDIADEYGCKRNTIQQWLMKHGIKKELVRRYHVRDKQYQDEQYLRYAHLDLHKSLTQIAKENNVSADTIRTNMIRYQIPYWRVVPQSILKSDDIDRIVQMYQTDHISLNQISQMMGVSRGVVKEALSQRGIPVRSLSDSQFLCHNSKRPCELDDPDLLYQWHWIENKSCKEIGLELGVNASTVRRNMNALGVPTKTNSESKIGTMTGEKHPNWKGGVTPLDMILREYFHSNIAPLAAQRDKYKCQYCGAEHTCIHVHHIKHFSDIVKEICNEHPMLDCNNIDDRYRLYDIITHDNRFTDLNNLITLCKYCHRKVHRKDKIISNQASYEEGSETIPQGSTSQAIGDGSARGLLQQPVI